MKKTITVSSMLFLFALMLACQQPKDKTEQTETIEAADSASTDQSAKISYTCTMHPEVVSDGPGKCPKCGMDLVKKEMTDEEMENKDSTNHE